MYHFFVDPQQILEGKAIVAGRDAHHIRHVLRLKPGDQISVSSREDVRSYLCRICDLTGDEVLCAVLSEREESNELLSRVSLYQGLPKADKMELIIQKAVELGVYRIIPVATRRSVVKLEEKKAAGKIARWQGIAESAAKQSKRGMIPQIGGIMSLSEALAEAADMQVKMIPYEHASGMEITGRMLQSVEPGQDIAVFIGPEGGFDESEIEAAKAAGVVAVTLGRRILRTETAGITMLAWIMYRLEKQAYNK